MDIKINDFFKSKISEICDKTYIKADILVNCIIGEYFTAIKELKEPNKSISSNKRLIEKHRNNFTVDRNRVPENKYYLPRIFSKDIAYLMLDLYKQKNSLSKIVNILKTKNIYTNTSRVSDAIGWAKQNPKP